MTTVGTTRAVRQSGLDAMFAPSLDRGDRCHRPGTFRCEGSNGESSRRAIPGAICPVNTKRDAVAGLRCYSHISQLPPVDLAIIVTPASSRA